MIKNLKEFKNLIVKYKSLTIDDIIEEWDKHNACSGEVVMNRLTGFGDTDTCSICSIINKPKCTYCVYTVVTGENCTDHESYDFIQYASYPTTLYKAIQERIEFMEKILETIKVRGTNEE